MATFLRLSQGQVHYKIEGPSGKGARPLVLVHGATVGLWEFEPILPYLHAAGFQTIRFDLYGHGLSERPRQPFTLQWFVEQFHEFIAHLKLPQPWYCLGHSMGGAICSAALSSSEFSHKPPLVLVAPLLRHEHRIKARPLLKLPFVGRAIIEVLGPLVLSPRRHRRLREAQCQYLAPYYQAQLAKAGYWRSLQALICDGALADHQSHYQALAHTELAKPPLLIWGQQDTIISAEDIASIRQLIGPHRYQSHTELAHNLLLTHPALLAKQIAEHLLSD